ncbi:MAG: Spx/MgsR family RNA polymerase-binding regulatory protein [Bdellovibrionota bacterium]
MKKLKVYEYAGCSTCKKALKFLDAKKVPYEKIDITSKAPTVPELKEMLGHVGKIGKLFNTSGLVYKELKLSEKLPVMSEKEAITLLASNGRLVKRPFVLGDSWGGTVGFKEDEWKKRV